MPEKEGEKNNNNENFLEIGDAINDAGDEKQLMMNEKLTQLRRLLKKRS